MRWIGIACVVAAFFGTTLLQATTMQRTSSPVEESAATLRKAASVTKLVGPAKSAGSNLCEAALPKKIVGNVTLPAGCTYSRELLIVQGPTVLDCNGAVFDGHGTLKIGLNIDSLGKPLKGVTVKNCTFQNYARGVLVGWSGKDASKQPQQHAFLYAHTPQDIRLEHITVLHPRDVGIYMDDYVQHVVIDHAVVRDSGMAGIYLEHSSRYIALRNSVVSDSGRGNRQGVPNRREALAIDSSAHDIVEGNTFENNTSGGIFLYRNCWEHADDPSSGSVYRWQHSDFNLIRDNIFRNEPIGVWIASRQSEDISHMHCGDAPMVKGDNRYYRDYADNNTVEGNTFCNVHVPVRIEGDRNIVRRNRFDRRNKVQVELPVTKREQLMHLPSVGNVVSGNKEIDCGK